MKNLFLLTVLSSLAGVLNVDKTNEAQSFFHEFAYEIMIIIILVSAFVIKYLWENRIGIHLMIFSNILLIKIIVLFNKISDKNLNKRLGRTKEKLSKVDNISIKTRRIVGDNIVLWENQINLHKKIAAFYKLKISSLVQYQNDLRLLTYLIKQVRKEPNTGKKLYQLEALISKISENVSTQLIPQLDTKGRKDNIIQLTDRIANFEVKVG